MPRDSARLAGQDQTFPDDRANFQRAAERVTERRDHLFGPARPKLRVDPGSYPDDVPEPGINRHVDQQGPEVVGDGGVALLAHPWQLSRGEQRLRGLDQPVAMDAIVELDPIVRGDDTAGQRRPANPDVEQVNQPPAGRDVVDQSLADPPDGDTLAEEHLRELPFRGETKLERRRERDASARPAGRSMDGQATALEGFLPGVTQLATGDPGCIGGPREHELPPLARGRHGVAWHALPRR